MQTAVTVNLDQEREIEFSNRAIFRMQSLARPFTINDLGRRDVGYAALVAWLWAMLVSADAASFPTPESLAEYVPSGGKARAARVELVKAVVTAIDASEPKNAGGSNRKRSPNSSSD